MGTATISAMFVVDYASDAASPLRRWQHCRERQTQGASAKGDASSRKQHDAGAYTQCRRDDDAPEAARMLALLIEHGGLTVGAVAPLLDLPPFVALRFADHLVRLGYATRAQDERYFATISGRGIDAVMRSDNLR
jgi:hypothetical protein